MDFNSIYKYCGARGEAGIVPRKFPRDLYIKQFDIFWGGDRQKNREKNAAKSIVFKVFSGRPGRPGRAGSRNFLRVYFYSAWNSEPDETLFFYIASK